MQLVTGSEWEAGRGREAEERMVMGRGAAAASLTHSASSAQRQPPEPCGHVTFFLSPTCAGGRPPNRLLLFSLSHEGASSSFASTVSTQGEEPRVCKGERRLGYRRCGSVKGGNLWPCCTHSRKRPALSFSFWEEYPFVFVSYGCCGKSPLAQWLKPGRVCDPAFLEVRGPEQVSLD